MRSVCPCDGRGARGRRLPTTSHGAHFPPASQSFFYFGYTALCAFAFSLMMGAVGFYSAYAFVAYIYSCVVAWSGPPAGCARLSVGRGLAGSVRAVLRPVWRLAPPPPPPPIDQIDQARLIADVHDVRGCREIREVGLAMRWFDTRFAGMQVILLSFLKAATRELQL